MDFDHCWWQFWHQFLMFLQNDENLDFGDSSIDFKVFTFPKHLLLASFFHHFSELFVEALLDQLFVDFLSIFDQKWQFWTHLAAQLGPKIALWADIFGPKGAKRLRPRIAQSTREPKKTEPEWLGSVIRRPFHFFRFWIHFCPSRLDFHRFGMDFSWFVTIFYMIFWIVVLKFSLSFFYKSALTFLNIFPKPQTPNPTTPRTISLKSWPGGMRVSDRIINKFWGGHWKMENNIRTFGHNGHSDHSETIWTFGHSATFGHSMDIIGLFESFGHVLQSAFGHVRTVGRACRMVCDMSPTIFSPTATSLLHVCDEPVRQCSASVAPAKSQNRIANLLPEALRKDKWQSSTRGLQTYAIVRGRNSILRDELGMKPAFLKRCLCKRVSEAWTNKRAHGPLGHRNDLTWLEPHFIVTFGHSGIGTFGHFGHSDIWTFGSFGHLDIRAVWLASFATVLCHIVTASRLIAASASALLVAAARVHKCPNVARCRKWQAVRVPKCPNVTRRHRRRAARVSWL